MQKQDLILEKHPYYTQSKEEKRKFLFKLILLVIALNFLFAFFLLSISPLVVPLTLITVFLSLSILAPFIDTPSMVKAEKIFYLSPMLLMEKERKGTIKLHGGTLLDYHFCLKEKWKAQERKRYVIKEFAEGLIELIERTENDNIKIKGSSYILTERTLKRLGFKLRPVSAIDKMILVFNILPITAANSMVHKKISFPKLGRTRTFEISSDQLKTKKETLRSFADRL